MGKTTLLRTICGLLRAKSGECTVMGMRSASRNPEMLKDIYFVPELFVAPPISVKRFAQSNSLLYPRWDAAQFEKLCLTFEVDPRWDAAQFEKLCLTFEVDPTYRFDKLSHGQQKKALIAFALALNTRVLLMDEPSNGLDIPSKTTLRRVISECATEDRVIAISTHQVRDLENLIDPIIILDRSGMGLLEREQPQRILSGNSQPRRHALQSEPRGPLQRHPPE